MLILYSRGFLALLLFSLQHDKQTHNPQHDRLQPRVLRKQNSHVPDKGHVRDHAPNNILPF